MNKVALCIATYLRPGNLRNLLWALNSQSFDTLTPPCFEVIVVDNDRERTAAKVCKDFQGSTGRTIHYLVQPLRGIAQARNMAVRKAMEFEVDGLVFIDDDEVPGPCWFSQLMNAQAKFNAGMIVGPVLPRFENTPPSWIVKGRYFDRPRYPTGSSVGVAGAGNLLVSAAVFKEVGYFDETLGLTGGEDTYFTLLAARRGFSIIWCDEATVEETVPPHRMNVHWLLKRSFRAGNTSSLIEIKLNSPIAARVVSGLKGVKNIGVGLALAPAGFLLGKHVGLKYVAQVCRGAGRFWGILGRQFEEYR